MQGQDGELDVRIIESIRDAQIKMLERKERLGEPVVIADVNGKPMSIPAKEAIPLYRRLNLMYEKMMASVLKKSLLNPWIDEKHCGFKDKGQKP